MSFPSSEPPPWSPQGTGTFTPPVDRQGTWPGPSPPVDRDRPWFHLLLLLATLVTTTYVGAAHYQGFLADFVPRTIRSASAWDLLSGGLLYSLPIIAILGAHEAGHYLVCRYYGVNTTLPYFLPMPLGIAGTLGAFIRIRSPIRTKPVLFDMAVAGPIAGFVTLLPFLVFGLAFSRVVRLPSDFVGYELGEPLLFRLLSHLIWGQIPEGYSLNMHPMAFAAWFGLLMTALNLFPIGQLDGGHVSYAVLGRRSTAVTIGTLVIAIGLSIVTTSWIVWTILMLALLRVSGLRHPPTLDDHVPLDRTRLLVAGLIVLIFIASFTPTPIQPYELIRPH